MKLIAHAATALILVAASEARAQNVTFERYQLSNGMTVILHEDHSLPVACINTWFYVGSKDEEPGHSGFAHLFEHLMFMGTRRVAGNSFDVIMERGGGFNNASTSEDRTNYFSFGPSNLLPTLLWLDADRLEDLGKEMTQEKVDKQREVVRNERRQTSEMQPYGRADLKIGELMYPPDHPYHHTVIGSHEDLEAATLQDVKDFFARYYVPNNACLVVAGDFDPAQIKPLVEKLFGTLPRGGEPPHKRAEPVSLNEVRCVTYTDNVQFPRLTFAYHSPANFAEGDAEMDLAAGVLGDGKNSRLYKKLVYEEKLATDVSANQYSSHLGSLFQVEVTAQPDASRERIEELTDEVLATFVKEGPTKDELERQKTSHEFSTISRLESLLARADQLNEYQFHLGTPDGLKIDLARYRMPSPGIIRDWAKKVLTPTGRLIMWVLPEKSATDLITARDTQPTDSADKPFTPQPPEHFRAGGIAVNFWHRPELPLVHVSVMMRGGAAEDKPQQAGLTYLTASMLDEGTGNLDALQFADAMDRLGARMTVSAGQEFVILNLTGLKKNIDDALSLFADAIWRPKISEKEWDRVKRLHVEGLKQTEDRAAVVAMRVGLRAFFGDDHPYGRPQDGTVETVSKLNVNDVRSRCLELFVPARARFFVAGDMTREEVVKSLENHFAAWQPGTQLSANAGEWDEKKLTMPKGAFKPSMTLGLPEPTDRRMRVVIVDKPDAVQTVIRFFMPGPKYTTPDRVRLEMLNTILGGSFTSRLNQNLREDKGYTYGARSSFNMAPSTGYFSAGADVQAEHTGAALKEFFAEFKKLRGGDISSEEAGKARETNRMDLVQSFQGLSGLVATAELLEQNGLPFDTIGDDLGQMTKINSDDLNSIASSAIPLDQALLVLVGKKELIESQIKDMGLPAPEQLTTRGEAVADSGGK